MPDHRQAVIDGLIAFINDNFGAPGTHELADLLHEAGFEVFVYGERLEWLSEADAEGGGPDA